MTDIFEPTSWQMTLGERAALEGVLSRVKPKLAVEIGTAEGGSLRRIAEHSEHVHSFDLVEPDPSTRELDNVTLHTGDSHRLLPTFLSEVASDGGNIDFALVDGDHSADGVQQDVENLLASPAIARTVILIHDTANPEVRRGCEQVRLQGNQSVRYRDFDFVAGHLSHGGAYHLQLWGGLGLILVDDGLGPTQLDDQPPFYSFAELGSRVRDALQAAEDAGTEIAPGRAPALQPSAPVGGEPNRGRSASAAVLGAGSGRITALLRRAAHTARRRKG